MNVLVACEYSGVVRDAFRRRGHNAISCDYLPSDRPGPHVQGDVLELLREREDEFDVMIAHPPCTYMSNSGALRLYVDGKKENGIDTGRWAKMKAAAGFFRALWECKIPKVCIENPVMVGHAKALIGVKQTQTIQPHWFGHPEAKATCLWLRGLDPLEPTNKLEKPASGRWDNQTPSGQNKLGPSPDRWKIRSTTYEGIADAMAAQWSRDKETEDLLS